LKGSGINLYKRAVGKTAEKSRQTLRKKVQAPAKRTGISASGVSSMLVSAQKSLNSQKPAVVKQTRTVIQTNSSWVNALQIDRNPAWVAPQAGGSYVWGRNDPNGPAAAVARRFLINRDIEEIDSATLFLAVDNYAIVFINGRAVTIDNPQSNSSFFNPGRSFDIVRFLRRGRNDIVIAAFNFPSNADRSASNPAGVYARIDVQFESNINRTRKTLQRKK